MKNPFKIVHKFKNDNNRIQYITYIFIGSLIEEEVVKILESIKDKDFYDSLIFLNPKKRKILEETYGDKWFTFLFINKHISYSIKKINEQKKLKNKIIEIHGKDWYSKNIELNNKVVKDLFKKNVPFSFSTEFQNTLVSRNKIKSIKLKEDEDKSSESSSESKINEDFRTYQSGGDMMDDAMSEMRDDEKMINELEKKLVMMKKKKKLL